MKSPWLEPFTWTVIVETNRQLWQSLHRTGMTLAEATDVCRRCHQLAPFCNFNVNTFVAVIRRVIARIPLTPEQAAALRSLAGHIVAGTATPEEQTAFNNVMDQLGGRT